MKKITLILSFLVACSVSTREYAAYSALNTLSEQRIKIKQANLKKELRSHEKIRSALLVAGGALTILSIYKFIRELCTATEIVRLPGAPHDAPQTSSQKIFAFGKKFGWFCAETAGAIAINYGLNQVLSRVLHDESLSWWITSHAPYVQTLELMEEHVMHYAQATTQDEATQVKQRSLRILQNLIEQFESVLAFMRYKSTVGEAHHQALKQDVIAAVHESMASFIVNAQAALTKHDLGELHSLMRQFKNQLNQNLIRFAYLDQ